MKTPDCWHYWEAADRSFTSDEWAAWCKDKTNNGATVERYGFHFNDADVCVDPHRLISIRIQMGGNHIPAELDLETFRGRDGKWGWGVWSIFCGAGSIPPSFSHVDADTEEDALRFAYLCAASRLKTHIAWTRKAIRSGGADNGRKSELAITQRALSMLEEAWREGVTYQPTLFQEDAL